MSLWASICVEPADVDLVKGTVSRDGRGMLLYIFRRHLKKNAIASDEKNVICVKGPVNHEHLKDSVMYQVLYFK